MHPCSHIEGVHYKSNEKNFFNCKPKDMYVDSTRSVYLFFYASLNLHR